MAKKNLAKTAVDENEGLPHEFRKVANKLGIITGSGPDAGIDMWSKILEENLLYLSNKKLEFRGDTDCPEILIHSLPHLGYSMYLDSTGTETDKSNDKPNDDESKHNGKFSIDTKVEKYVWNALKHSIEDVMIHSSFVKAFCITCNTLHYYSNHIKKEIKLINSNDNNGIKFISFVDCCGNYLIKNNSKNVVLLGADLTMDIDIENGLSPYLALITEYNINMKVPNGKYQHLLHNTILDSKSKGFKNKEMLNNWINILEYIDNDNKNNNNKEKGDIGSKTVVLLACTELPILAKNMLEIDSKIFERLNIECVDVTQLVAKEMIRYMYEG